jgi:hypothetical protein
MKSFIASLVAVIALSGCTAAEDAARDAAPTRDDVYIETLETRLPQFENGDREQLIDAGHMVCEYFEQQGVSLMSLGILSEQFEAQGFTDKETVTIFVVSTNSYCPDIRDELLALDTGGA